MIDPSDDADSESFAKLASAIRSLERLMATVRVSGDELLFHLAVVDFSSQVLEAAKATLALRLSAVPRAAWATARLCFEAMHDLFYLLELCPDRLDAGARIYVAALHAKAQTRGKLDGAAAVADIEARPNETDNPGLREFVSAEAEEIERISPGSKDAILKALAVRLKGGERHWSGLPRLQMTKRIRDNLNSAETASMFEAYYDALSVNAHPRLRVGEAVHIETNPVRVRIVPDPDDDSMCEVAAASAQTVELLLKTHVLENNAL